MALTIGELVGYISLEDKGFSSGVSTAERGLNRLQSETTSTMSSVESKVTKSLSEIEGKLSEGFDPSQALADINRLVAGFASDMDRMEREAARGGDGIVDQLSRALDNAEDVARRSGTEAGRGFSDGIGDGGGSRMSGIGDKYMGALKGLGWAAVGAAIGKLISDGIGMALDIDAAQAKLKAQVGDPAAVAEIGKAAGAVYGRGFTESLGEATEAARAVLSTGLVPKGDTKALEDLTVKAQAYAKAWDTDVAGAVQYASTLVGSGLAKDATNAFDLITEASRRVPTALREDVLEAGDEYAQFFRALGFSGEQAFGLLAKSAEKGKYGIDKTGDALKEFTLRATTMDKATKEAYQAIGLNAEKMSNDLLKGGDTAQSAFQKIVAGLVSIKDPTEQANTAIALFGTPLEDMNKADIPEFLANMAKVGDGLGDVSGKAKGTGDAFENSASQKLQAFKNSLQQNVVDFLGGTVVPALEDLGGKLNLSGIGEKIGPIVEKVKGFFSGLFTDIQSWVNEHQGDIQGWIDKIQSGFDAMSGAVSGVIDIIKTLWDEFGDDILNILGTLVDTLLGVWNGLWTAIKGVIDVFAGIITGDWKRVWEGVKGIFSGVWEAVKSIVMGALNLIKTQITAAWNAALSITGTSWDKVKTAVSTAITNVVDFTKKLPGRILDSLGDLGKLLYNAGRNVIQGLIDGIKSMVNSVGSAMSGIAQKIRDHLPFSPAKEGPLSGGGNPLYSGLSIANLLAQGIAQGSPAVNAVMDVLTKAVAAKAANALKLAAGVSSKLPAGIGAHPSGPSGPSNAAPVVITPAKLDDYAGSAAGGVVVNMYDSTIREEADIGRLGSQFGFELRARG